jgi:hypothetical protein
MSSFIELIMFYEFCWVFGAWMWQTKIQPKLRKLWFGQTQVEPKSAQLRTHARKHKENTSHALVQWWFDPRAAWKQPWIHGPTKERKWTKLTDHPPNECITHCPREMSVERRAPRPWVGFGQSPCASAEPHLSPTHAQPPWTESHQP